MTTSCGGADAREATLGIHYSHYTTAVVNARVGAPITITLRNDDPIEHEWIVGTEAVHERHRTGTEPFHGTIPTEVTIPAFSTRVTTVMFREPGDYTYICHLPGHEQYGMVGTMHVVAS
ncbi:MAG: cupredoxin domain-containing protein [Chloroflexota bacterium]|nr:cupredoxin domain-containing protein [Chloroflexota bacterium]